jgi:uncharacterized protein (TIGR00296 family)
MLTQSQGMKLIKLARKAIEEEFSNIQGDFSKEIKEFDKRHGVFVTLKMRNTGELRGCIGFPYPIFPLARAVIDSAKSAAFADPRFMPMEKKEFDKIKIEISVLSVPEEIKPRPGKREDIIKEIKIGEDGLIVQLEGFSGLLLPQVATEYKMNALKFLEETCQKAGLTRDSWQNKSCHVFKFQAQIFEE